jgi:hypothetical protein
MIGMGITQRDSGPIYTRAADKAAHDFTEELEDDIADYALGELRREMHLHFKNPTGYYESQVRIRQDEPEKVIHDGGVVYGPWLEGVGSRNFPVTRFRGYSIFRRVFQRVENRSDVMAARLLPRYLRRMGG